MLGSHPLKDRRTKPAGKPHNARMRLTLTFLALSLTGCGSLPTIDQERQTAASGFVGCAPAAIAVSAHQRYTWTASCKGKTYFCTVSPALACSAAK